MPAAALVRAARHRAGLTQVELARRAGTSQSAVSAIEAGAKQPTVATLERLLAAADARLVLAPSEAALLAARGRAFEQALQLAEALPFRRPGGLRFPRVPAA